MAGLLGSLLGSGLSGILAVFRSKSDRHAAGYNEAATAFRNSFTSVNQALGEGIDSLSYEVLNRIENQHAKGIELEHHMSDRQKARLRAAWNDYVECHKALYDDYEHMDQNAIVSNVRRVVETLMEIAKKR